MGPTTRRKTRRGASRVAAAAGALLVLPLASGCGGDLDEGETLTVSAAETVEVDGWDVTAELGDNPTVRAERGSKDRTWHVTEGSEVAIGPTVYRVQDVAGGGEHGGEITLVATDAEPPQ